MIFTPEDIYQFLVQSGARVTKYPDSFRTSYPGALISVEGYVNLSDVAARLNRSIGPQPQLSEPKRPRRFSKRKIKHILDELFIAAAEDDEFQLDLNTLREAVQSAVDQA